MGKGGEEEGNGEGGQGEEGLGVKGEEGDGDGRQGQGGYGVEGLGEGYKRRGYMEGDKTGGTWQGGLGKGDLAKEHMASKEDLAKGDMEPARRVVYPSHRPSHRPSHHPSHTPYAGNEISRCAGFKADYPSSCPSHLTEPSFRVIFRSHLSESAVRVPYQAKEDLALGRVREVEAVAARRVERRELEAGLRGGGGEEGREGGVSVCTSERGKGKRKGKSERASKSGSVCGR